jgi:Ion channel
LAVAAGEPLFHPLMAHARNAELRRRFLLAFWRELLVVWPILSGLIAVQLGLGLLVGYLEGWRISEAAYFTFVTGLTIGYGDLGLPASAPA